jgi:hypothetical protein
MILNRRLHLMEATIGQPGEFTPEQRRILGWIALWRLTPQKRAYLQSIGREDLIERAEPLQPLIEDAGEQRVYLEDLASRGITTLADFLDNLLRSARRRAQQATSEWHPIDG